MKFSWHHVASIFTIMLLSGAVGFAQVETGQIAGTVTDQSGAVVAGATVTITNAATAPDWSVTIPAICRSPLEQTNGADKAYERKCCMMP